MKNPVARYAALRVRVIERLLDQGRMLAQMRIKTLLLVPVLTLLGTGCAGNWSNYNYGPGDWLSENTALRIDTLYNYEHFIEPTIAVHYVESLTEHCGSGMVQGCASLEGEHCDIYVGKYASRSTIAHEERHCRGWSHYRPRYELFASRGLNFRNREVQRARTWYPTENGQSMLAMSE